MNGPRMRLAGRALVALGVVVVALGALPRPGAAAHGVVSMSWDQCSNPVFGSNIVPVPGGTYSLFVSVLGNDQTHNAYQVRFVMGSVERTVPDAWRFDAAGCQGSAFLDIRHAPVGAVAKTCPPFQGTGSSIQIKDFRFSPPDQGYATTLMRGVLANTYPAGTTSNPAQRYFLAEFLFNHLYSTNQPSTPGVTCGGLDTPLCLMLLVNAPATSTYLRQSDGWEFPFDPGVNFATVHGVFGCPAVPARPSTWGQVKNAYRR